MSRRLFSCADGMAPIPDKSESYERYTVRAHRALLRDVPDTDERNDIVWNAWRKYRGPTKEEKIAEKAFDPERYSKADGVCVFCEHETVDSQGQPQKYDLKRLARIARGCNERIRERRAFSAIADRHTSNPGDKNPVEPLVLGYSGPYRLGMIGDQKPIWGIFTSEYRFPGTEATFRQKNRRSVEKWTNTRTGEEWFDPIATCGAEAPRLPLPAHYKMNAGDGVVLERYVCAAPGYASVGAGSTFVRGHKADKYGDSEMKLDEESLNQIVDALMATPQMQFVTDQMSASPPGPGGMDQLPSPSAGAPGDEVPPAPGETGPDDDLSDLDDILGGDDDEPSPNPQTPEKNGMKYRNQPGGEVTREQYSQIKGRLDEYVEKYALLDKAHQHAMATIGQQGERLQVLERTAADAVRSERLTQVANDHPGFPMDLEEERKATLYSLGASMDDEAFEKHVATIEKYASRFVERVDIPGGAVPVGETQKEQYEARLSREAVKIATRYADSHGTSMNYDEALAAAREIVKQ